MHWYRSQGSVGPTWNAATFPERGLTWDSLPGALAGLVAREPQQGGQPARANDQLLAVNFSSVIAALPC